MLSRATGEDGEVPKVEGDEDVVSGAVVGRWRLVWEEERSVAAKFRFRDHRSRVFSFSFFLWLPLPFVFVF
jgi:hypothetical protein